MIEMIETVRAGLDRWRGSWPELADRAGVQYSWLTKFAAGRIPDPGVVRLGKLADFLRDYPRPE